MEGNLHVCHGIVCLATELRRVIACLRAGRMSSHRCCCSRRRRGCRAKSSASRPRYITVAGRESKRVRGSRRRQRKEEGLDYGSICKQHIGFMGIRFRKRTSETRSITVLVENNKVSGHRGQKSKRNVFIQLVTATTFFLYLFIPRVAKTNKEAANPPPPPYI